MPFPNDPTKYNDKALFTPEGLVAQLRSEGRLPAGHVPDGVIFSYQPHVMKSLRRRYRTRDYNAFYGEARTLKKYGNNILICGNFGIGAPAAASLLEMLIAMGCRRFISLGIAGGLQPSFNSGDIVVIDKAIRDEGLSHHYLPTEKFAVADEAMTSSYATALAGKIAAPPPIGAAWTTDALYRETGQEVRQYRDEGILAVDMEASALFAVGQFRNRPVASAFTISDTIDGDSWRLAYDHKKVQNGLDALVDAAIEVLAN